MAPGGWAGVRVGMGAGSVSAGGVVVWNSAGTRVVGGWPAGAGVVGGSAGAWWGEGYQESGDVVLAGGGGLAVCVPTPGVLGVVAVPVVLAGGGGEGEALVSGGGGDGTVAVGGGEGLAGGGVAATGGGDEATGGGLGVVVGGVCAGGGGLLITGGGGLACRLDGPLTGLPAKGQEAGHRLGRGKGILGRRLSSQSGISFFEIGHFWEGG